VFKPYNSPYATPIPANATPTAVTAAPNVNYPDVSSGGVMALANATNNFALRFVGERLTLNRNSIPQTQTQSSMVPIFATIAGPLATRSARLGLDVLRLE